jgi:hypothetical protein
MIRTALILTLAVFALAVTVTAQQSRTAQQRPQPAGAAASGVPAEDAPIPPPKEFQDLMKANAAISPEGNGGTLNQNLLEGAENYEGIVKDAEGLKANFAKLRAMMADLKIPAAIKWVDAGDEAINTMQRYAADAVWQQAGDEKAMAVNRREIERAQISLTDACRGCHLNHRVFVITNALTFQIAR